MCWGACNVCSHEAVIAQATLTVYHCHQFDLTYKQSDHDCYRMEGTLGSAPRSRDRTALLPFPGCFRKVRMESPPGRSLQAKPAPRVPMPISSLFETFATVHSVSYIHRNPFCLWSWSLSKCFSPVSGTECPPITLSWHNGYIIPSPWLVYRLNTCKVRVY